MFKKHIEKLKEFKVIYVRYFYSVSKVTNLLESYKNFIYMEGNKTYTINVLDLSKMEEIPKDLKYHLDFSKTYVLSDLPMGYLEPVYKSGYAFNFIPTVAYYDLEEFSHLVFDKLRVIHWIKLNTVTHTHIETFKRKGYF